MLLNLHNEHVVEVLMVVNVSIVVVWGVTLIFQTDTSVLEEHATFISRASPACGCLVHIYPGLGPYWLCLYSASFSSPPFCITCQFPSLETEEVDSRGILIPTNLGARCHIPKCGSIVRFGVITAVLLITQIWYLMLCH